MSSVRSRIRTLSTVGALGLALSFPVALLARQATQVPNASSSSTDLKGLHPFMNPQSMELKTELDAPSVPSPSVAAPTPPTVASPSVPSPGDPAPASPAAPPTTTMAPAGEAFLGILVERLDPALRSQLGGKLKDDSGVLVRSVMEGSPAEQAGIARYDILLQLNGQAMKTPSDLVRTVRGTAPGTRVELQLLRAGEEKSLSAKLGERENEREITALDPRLPGSWSGTSRKLEMQKFESLNIKKLDADKVELEFAFKNSQGQAERFVFQGAMEDVRKQIQDNLRLDENQKSELIERLKDVSGTGSTLRRSLRGLMAPMEDMLPHLRSLLHDSFDMQ